MSFIKSFFRPSQSDAVVLVPSNSNDPHLGGPSPKRPHLADRRKERRTRREQRAA